MTLYLFTMVVRIQISSINLKQLELELFSVSPVTVYRSGALPWVPKQRWLSTSLGSKGITWGWKIDHLDLGDLGGGGVMLNHNVSFKERIWQTMAKHIKTNRKNMFLHVIERYRCSNCLPNKIIHSYRSLFSPRGWVSMAIFKHVQDTTAGHILLELAKARIVQCHLQR